jgi:hypothetical protein
MNWGEAMQNEYDRLERAYFEREESIDFQICDHCGEEVEEWELINDDITCNDCKIYNDEHK